MERSLTKQNNPIWKLWPLLLAVLIYLPGFFNYVAFPSPEAAYTDMQLAHYPYALFLKNTILFHKQIPLWFPHIFSGTPFAANPLSGLWYPFGWIGLIFSLPQGLYFTAALHAVWVGLGCYTFLRSEQVGHLGALAGGAGAALLPKLSAHLGAGHLTLLYAFSWTPWLFLAAKQKRGASYSGLVLALIFLADPRWVVYAGGLWMIWVLAYRNTRWPQKLLTVAEAGGISLLISSPLLLPFLQFIRLSSRANMSRETVLRMSLPPVNILNLLFPAFHSNPEWVFYGGGLSLLLVCLAVFSARLRKRSGFWLASGLASLLLALGRAIPGAQWIASLPGLSLLRVPARSLFLTGFCLAVIVGISLDHYLKREINPETVRLISFGGAVFSFLIGAGIITVVGRLEAPFAWGLAWLLIPSAVLFFCRDKIIENKWGWLLLALLVMDLLGAGLQYPDWRKFSIDNQLSQKRDPTQAGDHFRVYSPSYSISQAAAVKQGLELVYGVDPLQYEPYAEYLSQAAGVPDEGYSVSLPPFRSGDPGLDNQGYIPDSRLMGVLNVRYMISAYPVEGPGWLVRPSSRDRYFYENENFLPRAWLENGVQRDDQKQGSTADSVRILEKSPNRVVLSADGPGRLVLSAVDYPGWRVKVDGHRLEITRYQALLRSVTIPPGAHRIEFKFRPLPVFWGIGLSLVGWIIFLWRKKQ